MAQRALSGVSGVDDGVEVETEVDARNIAAGRIHRDDGLGELVRRGLQGGQRVAARVGRGIGIGGLLAADLGGAAARRLSVAVDPVGLHAELGAVRTGAGRGHGAVDHPDDVVRDRRHAEAVAAVDGSRGAGQEVSGRVVELDRDTTPLHGKGRCIGARGRQVSSRTPAVVHVFEDAAGQTAARGRCDAPLERPSQEQVSVGVQRGDVEGTSTPGHEDTPPGGDAPGWRGQAAARIDHHECSVGRRGLLGEDLCPRSEGPGRRVQRLCRRRDGQRSEQEG